MRYYFAGAYARRAELAAYAYDLCLIPSAFVVSRWLDEDQAGEDAGFSTGGLAEPETVARAWEYGQRDIEDLMASEAIVSFTGEGRRGGRHVEHGFALAWFIRQDWDVVEHPFRLIVVGPREHVFHCHPAAEVYEDFGAFLRHERGDEQ